LIGAASFLGGYATAGDLPHGSTSGSHQKWRDYLRISGAIERNEFNPPAKDKVS
jgi:hypothetical protein